MFRYWLALVGLLSAPALAQPVFFDDFDGNALLPHWHQPAPSEWAYNVSNSMLNVTGLFYPSNPDTPGNSTTLVATYAPQSDFRMDVWMGWEAGPQPHMLEVWVGGPFSGSPIISLFGYRYGGGSGPDPIIIAGASNQAVSMAAPAPGIHQFTISRSAAQFAFYLDGSPFASFADTTGISAAAVWFNFVGPYPGQLGAFHIDRLQVVPGPSTWGLLLILTLSGAGHRRRRVAEHHGC